jgi:DNA polymerase elongation subunit (family B)
MESAFRIFDFNVYNHKDQEDSSDEEGFTGKERKDDAKFVIQMFGINEKGESCSILAENFKPFFYIKVDENWDQNKKTAFLSFLKKKVGKYYQDSICECKLIKKKKLYGFDGGKEHKFVFLSFENNQVFNKAKNLWYGKDRKLLENGLIFGETQTYLYEANIPPLLRFFHIKNISPSGWIALPKKKTIEIRMDKKTTCTYEFVIDYKSIMALNEVETRVPYKICSFDIEASSSHGDFPIPVKSYKKLATNIVEHFEKFADNLTPEVCRDKLREILLCAFGFKKTLDFVELVYPKKAPSSEQKVKDKTELWLTTLVRSMKKEGDDLDGQMNIEDMFEAMNQELDADPLEGGFEGNEGTAYYGYKPKKKSKLQIEGTVVDILCDKKYDRETKLNEINISLCKIFPSLEGDKVTFIGSTFLKYGDKDPYLNHCIALNTCSPLSSTENSQLESYSTEEQVLTAWTNLIQNENPDIIIGYNIFGFDYEFMFRRAEETGCVQEFLKLSRNKGEICANMDRDTKRYKLEETSIQIASGQHDLKYIKMNGRIQVDLYNFFRREENLTSYKLDYVAGHFIGDYVKTLDFDSSLGQSTIKTGNMTGLLEGSYIHLEEIGHSTDYYEDGAKFQVVSVDKIGGKFVVNANLTPDFSKKVRWCLAKDDVTPKDIFELTNGTADDRAIIAKYCIQDCNLVHYLMNKVDVLTGFVEMASICSVPISFLVLRGQGIKLTSYVAKKCREKGTLMPVLEKLDSDDGYEGAIVLDPKCDLYLDNPVACVDYASLYPSSMMSENLSHDSKVWTKEYNLNNELLTITGETNETGEVFIYDNLPEYEYVDICYDTFKYVRKSATSAAEKIKSGYKICRFAQFPEGTRAIMPSILEELLMARKTTRKLIPQQTDEFMKNVLDKRQLGYKVTANSLYGQCGARTSTFYEKDIAASTTATGRKLLTYAKRIIEETYGDAVCETSKYGPVLTKAEYIYGDSVAKWTKIPILINKTKSTVVKIEELSDYCGKYNNKWKQWIQCTEPGKQEKEYCELEDVKVWTESGWTQIHRVIRHNLASHKKMIRIQTTSGSQVDVTDDHSLLSPEGKEISPKDCKIGTELLSCKVGSIPTYEVISEMTEIHYEGYVYDLTTDNHHFAAGIGNLIVHNTDSVFFTFNLQTTEGEPIKGKKALEITIELAKEAGHLASQFLKQPHDLEYEKTFMPFCLLSKKRYVGMLYEDDPDKCKRKEMGIVLKRRDNAPIVKDVYGGIIDILMKEQDIGKATEFLRTCLRNIVNEAYPIDKLVITKSLRSGYKNPQQIAHKVLADRMTARDPGNKPSSGDRIPFVYIHNPNKKALQGEKIETPAYIKQANLKIDYSHYITNQIMKPVQQVFALVLEKMWSMKNKTAKISKFKKEVQELKKATPEDKFEDKLEKLKNSEVKTLLFDEFLRETNNQKQGNVPITSLFGSKK